MAADDRREQVARLVKQGRLARGLSISAAAREADVDRATWTGVEKATRIPRDAQAAAIERVAGLTPDTIASILEGRQPKLGTQASPAADDARTASPEKLAEMYLLVEDELGTEEAERFLRRVMELRRQAGQGDERAHRRGGRAAG